MGKLEKEVKLRIRKTKVVRAVISVLAMGGVLAMGAVAPNVFKLLRYETNLNQRRQNLNKSIARLIEAGYLSRNGSEAHGTIRLTSKGEALARILMDGEVSLKRQKRWDGKWRVVIFDIAESRRRVRKQLRATITRLGFVRLQDSVWVWPYDCEDLVTFLKADMHIGGEVLYMIVDQIENDRALRQHFRLP